MDPDSISNPPLCLCVGKFAEDTTPGNLRELLTTNDVKGAAHLAIIKKEKEKPYAIVTFTDAQLASNAVPLVNKKDLNGKEIAASIFVHDQYIIEDKPQKYKDFIGRLRNLVARRKEGTLEYIDEGEDGKSGTTNPLVLGEQRGGQCPKRWIHIKLFAKGREESTTLVIRDDNLYVKGFTGKDGRWFELCEVREPENEKLPKEIYGNPTRLTWGSKYDNLMKLNDREQVKETLENTKLGKDFAVRAVLRLSRYCLEDVENNDDIPVRVGLAGLIVMICESARFNPILNYIADSRWWKQGRGLEQRKDLAGLIWNWKNMSAALLKWKNSRGKVPWNGQCGADTLRHATEYVRLVLKAKDRRNVVHVEVLGVSANLDVGDINVIDENNQLQNIYAKKQGHDANKELELNVRDTGTGISSGREWFVMRFNLPHPEHGVEDRVIERRWDCRKEQDGDATELVNRTIGLDDAGHKIVVSYLVMSNAKKAKVVVKLAGKHAYLRQRIIWGNGGSKYTAYGKITAQIVGLEHHPIVLFRKAKEEAIPIERLTLSLDRSVVQVPQGKGLQIDMKGLHVITQVDESPRNRGPQITGSFNTRELQVNGKPVIFPSGESRPNTSADDVVGEVQVTVNWETRARNKSGGQELNFDINDFATSIANLRKTVAHRDNNPGTTEYVSTGDTKHAHPVLARPRANQPPRWIHIKLLAADEEKSPPIIAVRDDNCCGFGFRNRSGVWYDLGNRALPAEYNSVPLDWGVSSKDTTLSVVKDWDEAISYKDILNVEDWNEAVSNLESSVERGKNFAKEAVRTLWRYPDVEERVNPRLALAGLMVMVCESAKLNTLYEYFVERWDTGSGRQSFSELRLMDHIRNWGDISRALLYWRDHGYCKWHKYLPKETMDIISPGVDPSENISDRADQALRIVHLVFNWQDQIDMEYDIEDKEGFTAFIGKLREKLAYHFDREDLLDRRLDLPAAFSSASDNNHPVLARYRAGQPARWFHIKLKLMEGNKEEKSTTLAIRDDNLLVVGFMNEKGIWYELPNLFKQSTGSGIRILPAEYNSELLDWDWSRETMRDLLAGFDKGQPSTFLRNLSSHDPAKGSAIRELMGLTIMVCESARLNSICDFFASGGVGDKFADTRHYKPWQYDNIEQDGFIEDLLRRITNWDLLSYALLTWKDGGYFYDISDEENLKNTLGDIHLVLNRQPPPRLYEIYEDSSSAH